MKTTIKKCTVEDLSVLQQIGTDTYNETYSHLNTPENINEYIENAFNTEQLQKELSNPSSTFLFQYVDNILAGYLKVNEGDAQTFEVDKNALEIERIFVKNNFHSKGLGKILLQKAIEIAKEKNKNSIWLGVWRKNKNAIDFHKNMGFETQGSYSTYIGDEEQDMYIMVKKLT
ncbi:negative regulation of sporulation, septation and degradative enzyme [Gracilibacillus boraciitolerans JCM 21714]|uniref:Negative regulation of sporulation, septation and degradative enzyme n=1 Tax=Gracilibacillus boraciitolerans JCM 21714 TaxID=1298598 RepID=W4VID7_9BACI|nr:GNAT family N-acetyltransferase [Gracilibacillus boraciitolerans]GAE92583.1 negative regulation of sporulation, septation and degradative enzyme [Gracilibacillus boraciitolerans JCM 21714]